MLNPTPILAPTPTVVRYLAVFQRFFEAVEGYTRAGDKPGMLLGGWLADALHNVPGMLWHCTPDAWHNPTDMERWMDAFPERIQHRGAPQRLVEDSIRVLSAVGGTQDLGIKDDLADLDLAPLPQMGYYLDRLYDACLLMRFTWSNQTDLEDTQAAFNGELASALLPIPKALVHWGQFDEEQFREDALRKSERISEDFYRGWMTFFMKARE